MPCTPGGVDLTVRCELVLFLSCLFPSPLLDTEKETVQRICEGRGPLSRLVTVEPLPSQPAVSFGARARQMNVACGECIQNGSISHVPHRNSSSELTVHFACAIP